MKHRKGEIGMKCDVCFQEIPFGKDRCPNCGYKIKRKSTIASSTMEQFYHIESKKKMPEFDYKSLTKRNNTSKKKNPYRPANASRLEGILKNVVTILSTIFAFLIILMIILVFAAMIMV